MPPEIRAASRQYRAPPNDQSEAQAKTGMDSLSAMAKGKAWAKNYIDYEVTYHQAVIQIAPKTLLRCSHRWRAPVAVRHLAFR